MQNIQKEWLTNPEIFAKNRLVAHSNHRFTIHGENPIQILSGEWKFKYFESQAEVDRSLFQPKAEAASLDTIKVPGHFELQGYGSPQYVNVTYPWEGNFEVKAPSIPMEYNPVGCYIKDVEFNKIIEAGRRKIISFQGVESAFFLYVNGQLAGYSEDSFTPAEFDITEYIVDGTNRIGVEVYKWSTGSWLEDQDFYRFAGIFRDVYVYAIGEIHMTDLFIHTDVLDNFTQCDFSVEAKADMAGNIDEYDFSLTVSEADGQKVINVGHKAFDEIFGVKYRIDNAKLWSAEIPYLYTAEIIVFKNAVEIEKITQRVGLRRFEIVNKIMQINGKRIELNGVNRHEFDYRKGRCLDMEEMLWDIRFMKQHNINAVRTCHYPDNPVWYDLCDEYGIYVIDETNLETHGTWGYAEEDAIPGDKPEWKEAVLDRANSMVQRDKNHPSVIIWSCGNESFGGSNIFQMSELMRKLDSSRVIHYEGIFRDRRYPATSDIESRMYERTWNIEEYLNNNPDKPFINCEYSHAMGNSCGGIEEYTNLLDRYPMYQGGFIWDFVDQAMLMKMPDGTERIVYGGDFDEVPDDNNFCGDGIVFADRTPSPKAQEVKYVYSQLRIIPDFTEITVVNKRLFKDTSDLYLKIQLLKDGEIINEKREDIVVEPLCSSTIPVNFTEKMNEAGEYFVQAFLCCKMDTLWAEKGFCQAFGKSRPRVIEAAKAESVVSFKDNNVRIVHGSEATGIHFDDRSVYFSRRHGGAFSYKLNNQEFFVKNPMPVYYRAATDNERGCQYMFDSGAWQFAEKRQRCIDYKVEENLDSITIHYVYELPLTVNGGVIVQDKREQVSEYSKEGNGRKGITTEVIWKVYSDKKIDVSIKYNGVDGLPELPLFGMEFALKPDFENFKYYGYGPEENYTDRNSGAMIGIFKSSAADNFTPYLKPQTCGNRTETRWLSLTDGAKYIKFTAKDNQPFQFTVLHNNEHQLEEALHREELPNTGCTYVKIMPVECGVGGDDSWGSQVREYHRIKSNTDISYDFSIEIG